MDTTAQENWETGSEKGRYAEEFFSQIFPDQLLKLPGRKSDYLILANSAMVEVKGDYELWRTGNIFLETWSRQEYMCLNEHYNGQNKPTSFNIGLTPQRCPSCGNDDIRPPQIGGPRQAKSKGSKYFAYLCFDDFWRYLGLYCFQVDDLVRFLDDNEHNYRPRPTIKPNRNGTTIGIPVPVAHLSHLAIPVATIFTPQQSALQARNQE